MESRIIEKSFHNNKNHKENRITRQLSKQHRSLTYWKKRIMESKVSMEKSNFATGYKKPRIHHQ